MPSDLGVHCRSSLGVFLRSELGVRACDTKMSFLASVNNLVVLIRHDLTVRTQATDLGFANGCAIDPDGYIWVHGNDTRFRVYSPSGSLVLDETDVLGFTDSAAAIVDLTVDEDGNGYLTMDLPPHSTNHTVWSISRAGGTRWTFDADPSGLGSPQSGRRIVYRDNAVYITTAFDSDVARLDANTGNANWQESITEVSADARGINVSPGQSKLIVCTEFQHGVSRLTTSGAEDWHWLAGNRINGAAALPDDRVIAGGIVSSSKNVWLLDAAGNQVDSAMVLPSDNLRAVDVRATGTGTAYVATSDSVVELSASSSNVIRQVNSNTPFSGVLIRYLGQRVGADLESWLS